MAYTQTDIDNLEKAMKTGVLEVEYNDRRVKYRSLSEMKEQLAIMQAGVSGSTRPNFADTIYDRT